ncbi:phosphoribosylformylglycinamidine synthase subunit PurQ [Pontibacter sp. G13]|uniref:phosphoribosylformylglycinamidine synthase subunit PurQ n=1 Tax=Pontibacter sp. G13 TaxID=3074898 RepID=UPI00288B7B5C|nr:phosphoribosylformylglycinamidine synthase subunit PurQ [Pontibacter sp. G13]WNJ21310.1 phosphoribosylformylglycinamidine synthase subunit PurQ [Pontibacter sp. G13]
MKFGVITFPGSNCDHDLIYSLSKNLGQEVVHLWHKDTDLQGCDFVFLPGGFSYGDYLRSGAIARFSPIMDAVIAHANKGGYVMGICNGFQMLTEAGLLPGALLHNITTNFICKNVHIKPVSKSAKLTATLEDRPYLIPVAHGEGNYYCSQEDLKMLQDNDQILFQYCDEVGQVTEAANPNGSLMNIAGVTNAGKNVFGMMPHPERASDELLGNLDGKFLLETLVV